jgi:hypothetical protein
MLPSLIRTDKLESIEMIGCSHSHCPDKIQLLQLTEQVRALGPEGWEKISAADKKLNADWGHNIKFCFR